jgi:hypothetical protein
MKHRRLATIAFVTIVALVALFVGLVIRFGRTSPLSVKNFSGVLNAVSNYVHDHPGEQWVSTKQLQEGGYISNKDLEMFEGAELSINLGPDEGRVQEPRLMMRMQDGRKIIQLGDGSSSQVR